MTHRLKTIPPYFQSVLSGLKTFEVRVNDRDFKVGDILILKEWLPLDKKYTGRYCIKQIYYIMPDLPDIANPSNFIVMSIAMPS